MSPTSQSQIEPPLSSYNVVLLAPSLLNAKVGSWLMCRCLVHDDQRFVGSGEPQHRPPSPDLFCEEGQVPYEALLVPDVATCLWIFDKQVLWQWLIEILPNFLGDCSNFHGNVSPAHPAVDEAETCNRPWLPPLVDGGCCSGPSADFWHLQLWLAIFALWILLRERHV